MTYAGTSAFSEIETRSLAEYLESISEKLFAYISFHSYSQLLMFPYGHTEEKLDNYVESVCLVFGSVVLVWLVKGAFSFGTVASRQLLALVKVEIFQFQT